jgi:hypothetical protein
MAKLDLGLILTTPLTSASLENRQQPSVDFYKRCKEPITTAEMDEHTSLNDGEHALRLICGLLFLICVSFHTR